MWNQLPYLVETQICLAVLWLLYRLVMGRDGHLGRLRAYLLLCVPVAFLLPLLSIPLIPASMRQPVQEAVMLPTVLEIAAPPPVPGPAVAGRELSWPEVLAGVALAGSLVMLAGLLWPMRRWYRLVRHARFVRIGNARVAFSGDADTACSFFGRVVINREGMDDSELEQVMLHELSHVRLRHSWDRVLAGLLTVAVWWNPFVWLWRRSLCEVHEYQADRAVLNHGFDSKRYISLIVRRVTDMHPELVSGFSYSLLKND